MDPQLETVNADTSSQPVEGLRRGAGAADDQRTHANPECVLTPPCGKKPTLRADGATERKKNTQTTSRWPIVGM